MIFITYKTTDTAVISFVFSSGIIEGRVYSPYVNKAFVYISVFKILNNNSTTIYIINDQDTTIKLCKNIKWNKNLIKVFISRQETPIFNEFFNVIKTTLYLRDGIF